jgi:hypothetical protein
MKCISRRHAAHREELKLAGLTFQFRHRFEPVHLGFLAPVIALRHERQPTAEFLLRFWMYCRTVTSATGKSGCSSRNRIQMRCAVCRCLRGACRSASSIPSIASFMGVSLTNHALVVDVACFHRP